MLVVIIFTFMVIASYLGLMVWLYIGIQETKSFPKTSNERPVISVVVSLKNEAGNVSSLLKGLLGLDYPKEKLEIILVNDNSTDGTFQSLRAFESVSVIVLDSSGAGKKQAIETAVNMAVGEWVLVTDADCEVPSSWVNSMVQSIEVESKMILGPVFIKPTISFLTQLQSIEFLGLQGTTCGSAGMGYPISANAANMMFKKDVFEDLKPYQDNYEFKTGDDQFLLMAITNRYPHSVNYSLNKESIIYTNPVKTWRKYFSQRIRWASKGRAYSQLTPKLTGLLVVAFSLVILIDWNLGFQTDDLRLAFLPVLVKMTLDLLVILPMKKFSGVKVNPIFYPISVLVYAWTVVITVVIGLFRK